jgi:uncharacterized protein (DUF305 family)
MSLPRRRAALLACALLAACAAGQATPAAPEPSHTMTGHDMAAMAPMSALVPIPDGATYTEADVRFMQGMIAHHAQAIHMSRLAADHQASPRLQKLAGKIDQSQVAEIRLMQEWLAAHGQAVPDTSSWRHMTMPGMLTAAQLEALDASRGADFDQTYLRLMIQHHEGALAMVDTLFATPRAGQDVDISVFANDVQQVQTAEIGMMQQMLADQ